MMDGGKARVRVFRGWVFLDGVNIEVQGFVLVGGHSG